MNDKILSCALFSAFVLSLASGCASTDCEDGTEWLDGEGGRILLERESPFLRECVPYVSPSGDVSSAAITPQPGIDALYITINPDLDPANDPPLLVGQARVGTPKQVSLHLTSNSVVKVFKNAADVWIGEVYYDGQTDPVDDFRLRKMDTPTVRCSDEYLTLSIAGPIGGYPSAIIALMLDGDCLEFDLWQ
ncbi:MAG: hypothetical protein ACYTFV_09325 [Planctomycetota bacterium]